MPWFLFSISFPLFALKHMYCSPSWVGSGMQALFHQTGKHKINGHTLEHCWANWIRYQISGLEQLKAERRELFPFFRSQAAYKHMCFALIHDIDLSNHTNGCDITGHNIWLDQAEMLMFNLLLMPRIMCSSNLSNELFTNLHKIVICLPKHISWPDSMNEIRLCFERHFRKFVDEGGF